MVALTDYWYYGQIERIVLHTCRFFCNFYISVGKDANGEDILKRVPCQPAFKDKTVASLIAGNSDNVMQFAPRMIVQLHQILLKHEKAVGPAYYTEKSIITERLFDEVAGNYVDGRDSGQGATYEITRMNPIPIGLVFKLHILTTMDSQKFQLFEQIRPLFTPTNEIQVSENPLDWNRIGQITLTDLDYSSKISDLNSNNLDDMVMTFEVDTNLDLPTEITRNKSTIEEVNFNINSGIEDNYGWVFDAQTRTTFTPTECSISVSDNSIITLLDPYSIKTYKSWKYIYDMYKIPFSSDNLYISLLTNPDNDNRKNDIIGKVSLTDNPSQLSVIIDADTLPSSTIQDIDDIIDPLAQFPGNGLPEAKLGQRYLIISDISSNTTAWGIILDENGIVSHAKENQILEYMEINGEGHWVIDFNPYKNKIKAVVRCMADDLIRFLYHYDPETNEWSDYINRIYKAGYFQLWIK